MRRSLGGALLLLGALSLLAALGCAMLGSARLTPAQLAGALQDALLGQPARDEAASIILLRIRLPRVALAYVVGAALAVSGACMQGVFKNPMADPHVLGVSSGAALGAALGMLLPAASGIVPVVAFAGGLLAAVLVYQLARWGGAVRTVSLLLAGVAVSSLLTALTSLIMLLHHDQMEKVLLFTMGSFGSATWGKVLTCLGPALLALGGALALSRELNALLLGEEQASALGVRVGRVRLLTMALTTLATACAVSVSGVIGFVGLMVPHAVRFCTGPDHRRLLPVSALCGGVFLMGMDTLARTLAAPSELPVGVLTAVVGAPFFLYLMRANLGKGASSNGG